MALPPPTPLRDLELVSPVVLPPQRRSRLGPGSANPPAAVFLLGSGARQPASEDRRRRPVVLVASHREGSLGGLLRDSQDVEDRLEDHVSLVYWHKVLLMANSSSWVCSAAGIRSSRRSTYVLSFHSWILLTGRCSGCFSTTAGIPASGPRSRVPPAGVWGTVMRSCWRVNFYISIREQKQLAWAV
jgi:hypothetical protein